VEDGLATREEMVRDDATMASPPHGLGAHDRATLPAPFANQAVESRPERRRERVVGIVVEADVGPQAVHIRRQAAVLAAQATECGGVLVGDTAGRERGGERIVVELRIGSRARDLPDIHDAFDARPLQDVLELAEAAVGVANREEGQVHERPRAGIRSRSGARSPLEQPGGLMGLPFALRAPELVRPWGRPGGS